MDFFDLPASVPSCLGCSIWNLQTIFLPTWETLANEGAAYSPLFILSGWTEMLIAQQFAMESEQNKSASQALDTSQLAFYWYILLPNMALTGV